VINVLRFINLIFLAILSAISLPANADELSSGAPSESSKTSANYIIGPGDVIQVFVWRNPELTVTVPVRPDGKVSTPLVEDMVAVGKTPTALARDIEAHLGEYVRSPQVSVIVNTAVSTFSQIKLIGQVKSPQSIPYREGMTVLDAILAVGGLTDFASGNKAKITRKDASGRETLINVRIEDLISKGKLSENQLVKPGDVIVVPESFF
jgi:polysaccharide export outer membrane protein